MLSEVLQAHIERAVARARLNAAVSDTWRSDDSLQGRRAKVEVSVGPGAA